MIIERYDLDYLTTLFENCRALDKLTLAIGPGPNTYFNLVEADFKECLLLPGTQHDATRRDDQTFLRLLHALDTSGREIKHVNFHHVVPETLMETPWSEESCGESDEHARDPPAPAHHTPQR